MPFALCAWSEAVSNLRRKSCVLAVGNLSWRRACLICVSPGFTVVAVLTLALGIGVNTAIFSALNATIFHPLAYENPEQLVMVWGVEPKGCCRHRGMVFSSPNFLDFKDQNRAFESMSAFAGTGFTLTSVGNPEKIHAGLVTADFFRVFGAQPMLGGTFLPDENQAGH